jgi:spermidine/putrescine transport system substrate-binding protein
MKKKIICAIAALAFSGALLTGFYGCSAKRSETLRIANWGEYMPEDVYDGFVDWYKEKTGDTVKIEYTEFDTNETMYTWIATKHEDYDLICPSDYMMQRMKAAGLIRKLDDDTVTVLNESINPSIISLVKNSCDADFSYFMPYVWGTLGIMFNAKNRNAADMNTWEVFWNAANAQKIYMKDSVRDAYSVALIYANREALRTASDNFTDYTTAAYQSLLKDIFSKCDANTIAQAKSVLEAQKQYVADYEVDSAKDEMVKSPSDKFGLFWSCDAGYAMNGGDEAERKNLYYLIPEEGGNVWVDGFAIPKYAANTKAANYFIQYLCGKDVAYECMDYVGSTTAVNAAAEQYKADLIADEDGFFDGTYDGFKEMYLEMMFPSEQTLARCGVMLDFPEYNEALDEMWIEIALDE